MEQTLRWRLIPSNPCAAVEPPERTRPKVSFRDRARANRFLALTADEALGPCWAVAVHTGLRRAELCGLRWSDVDLDRRTLKVELQVKKIDGTWQQGPLKTPNARRAVPLAAAAVEALREQRRRQNERRLALGAAWHDLDLVFDHDDGSAWSGSALSAAFRRRLLAHPEISPLRLHDLRHTAASLMLAAGLSLFEGSRILGHAAIAITADLYGHLAADTLDAARIRLDAAAS